MCIKEPCSQTDDYRENEADKHTAKGDHQKRCHARQIVERFQIIFTNVREHHKHFVEDLCKIEITKLFNRTMRAKVIIFFAASECP